MTNPEPAAHALPTSVTVPAGHPIRISAQTASRDYTATAVGGTYPIEYTRINHTVIADPIAERPYYALVRLPIVSPARTESSAEFGGVALAWREIDERIHEHTLTRYAYEFRGKTAAGALVLHY